MVALCRPTCRRSRSQKRWAIVTMVAMLISPAGGPAFVPTVSAQVPVGAGFTLNAGDLRFIFRQIQIAQAHSANPLNPLVGTGPNQIAEPRLPFGLRTVDGSFNHLDTTTAGKSDELFPRMTEKKFREAENGTSYEQLQGTVTDRQPRIISNLIADQTQRNPSARAIAGCRIATDPPGGPLCTTLADPLGTLPIGNVAPDAGLSAPFNSMFTFFGQFFDHGLDLVNKGGNGTVFVPLQPDDPLFVTPTAANPNPPNFMMMTRATVDAEHEATNQTTPFVDQNQTYTSHPSHQAFLREYALDTGGRPRATGRLIDGDGGNIGNWNEVKAQAKAMLGIVLVDADVNDVPLLVTDPYGHLRRNAQGFPMAVLTNGNPVVLTPNGNQASSTLRKTNHQFLNDIAHNAVPGPGLTPDAGPGISEVINGVVTPAQPAGTYDDDLLGIHFVTGDGRGNENIALTAVHQVFHAEHNRLQANIDTLIHTPSFGLTAAEVLAWETTDSASGWDYGERLFQASRFVTEMQYQHLVFEEFARKIAPSINAFIGDGINFVPTINPAIVAEFAHQTYRLGHSMLTETIARTAPNGTEYDIPLLDGFLNPAEYNRGANGQTISAAEAAGAIFQGGTRQVGMEIDEFVTEAVRNRLLGLPLDLAVLNLSRGRSEGVAPLNVIRNELFLRTGDFALTPYADWFDFSLNMRHPESLANFVAAYGKHATLASPTLTMAERRAAALALVGDPASGTLPNPDFMFLSAAESGVDDIDLWIGGLAEKPNPFGGLLGPTFNHVFEIQLENLQDGDRFYYLERLDGLNLLSQLEGNSFAELISRNTTLTGPSADVFARPDMIFNMSAQKLPGEQGCIAVTGGCAIVDDPATDDPNTVEAGSDPDERFELIRMPNGTIRYAGPAHVIFNGRNDAVPDRIFSSEGDDTLRGNAGDDVIEGGAGNDNHLGGDGDDILTDTFGEDVIKGGPGNDAISGGSGPFDLLQGNDGIDFIVGGNDESEVFGGPGDDIIYMGAGLSESVGGAGDDWMEGTISPASIAIGDDNNQFQNDPNGGNDILVAGPGDMDFDAEGGDDIMVGTVLPTHRFEGMLGFDWVTYRGETLPVDADMAITGAIAVNAPLNENRDRFDLAEGLSGSAQDDLLRGDDRTAAELANDGLSGTFPNHHVLTQAGIARILGLAAILPAGATTWGEGNIILGGAGSDLLEGRGGNDILDGDRWLNVQLVGVLTDGTVKTVDSLQALKADVFAGRLKPGAISFVRSIVTSGSAGIDTARFSGPRADYTIQGPNNAGIVTVTDNVGDDGVDTIRNVEQLQFPANDGPDGIPRSGDETVFETISTGNNPPTGGPVLSQTLPQENEQLQANPGAAQNFGIADADGIQGGTFALQWQQGPAGGGGFVNIAGANARQFTPMQAQVGQLLRVIVSYTDGSGRQESVASAASGVVGDVFVGTAAADNYTGTAGRDDASGAGGNDILNTGDAADVVSGGAGSDTLTTGAGNDTATGGGGNDVVNTGSGDDIIRFNENDGFDNVNGGAGVDEIRALANGVQIGLAALSEVETITANGNNNVTIQGSDAANTLDFSAVTLTGIISINGNAGNDNITGSAVADTINGNDGTDTINGGGGADNINGGGDADTLNGEGGNDTIDGGGAADQINGGAGTDTITGGAGADTINGAGDNDTINGDGGNDVITGGAGNDTMTVSAANTLDNDVFVFAAGFGGDTIIGFGATQSATVGQDLLDLRAIGITAANFAASVTIAGQGNNTVITVRLPGTATVTGTITLNGVQQATVTVADFIVTP